MSSFLAWRFEFITSFLKLVQGRFFLRNSTASSVVAPGNNLSLGLPMPKHLELYLLDVSLLNLIISLVLFTIFSIFILTGSIPRY